MVRNNAVLALTLFTAGMASASVPEWVRQYASTTLNASSYDDETSAVILLDDQTETVQPNGEIIEKYRRVVRILRPQGSEYAFFPVHFSKDQKISSFRAYTLTAKGVEFELKEKDAVEHAEQEGVYDDSRFLIHSAAAPDPGNLVAFEYEKRLRPYLLETVWGFQERMPIVLSRYTLTLPAGWEFTDFWINHASQKPTSQAGNVTVWEMKDVPRISHEHAMPSWEAVAGRMALHLSGPGMQGRSFRTWEDFGGWYNTIAADRRGATPAITTTVHEVTASSPDFESKVRSIALWMQHQIRYVSIQIGIGGLQPHAAGDIYRNRYGDCKDKVTLMSTMLKEVGIDSSYVIVNLDDRDAVTPAVASHSYFNHAILAVKLPHDEFAEAPAAFTDKSGQRWLLFDPTAEHLPVGYIEGSMQGSYGLLVKDKGELVRIPLTKPEKNYYNFVGKLKLATDGSLSGDMTMVMAGDAAMHHRALIGNRSAGDLHKSLEHYLNEQFAGATLSDIKVENLDEFDKELRVTMKLKATGYAKNAGPLLLVRPRVLGHLWGSLDSKPRLYPYEFDYTEAHNDDFEIELPPGFAADELPRPVNTDVGFARYTAKSEVTGNILRYKRTLQITDPEVPVNKIEDLRRLFLSIAADEKNSAVFKKVG